MESHIFLLNSPFNNQLILVGLGAALLVFIAIAWNLSRFKKAQQGEALVRSGVGGIQVSFNSIIALPVIHKLDRIDIKVKEIGLAFKGDRAVRTKDNLLAEMNWNFYVRVNPDKYDVLKVAQSVGCDAPGDPEKMRKLFTPKFEEAVRVVILRFDFAEIEHLRERIREEVIQTLGVNLNGFHLDDAAFSFMHPKPLPLPKGAPEI